MPEPTKVPGPLTLTDGTTWTFFYRPATDDWHLQLMGPKRAVLYTASLSPLDAARLSDYLERAHAIQTMTIRDTQPKETP